MTIPEKDSNDARNAWLESTERKNAIASMPSPERRQRKIVKPPPADKLDLVAMSAAGAQQTMASRDGQRNKRASIACWTLQVVTVLEVAMLLIDVIALQMFSLHI